MTSPTGQTVVKSAASVDDLLWLDALPPEVRARLRRIFGGEGEEGAPAPAFYSATALRDAYEAGWEDGQEAVEIEKRDPRDYNFEQHLKSRTGKT